VLKRTLFTILWVVFVGILHLFGNNMGTFIILLASITIPILCGFTLVFAAIKNQPVLTLPGSCVKGDMLTGTIAIRRSKFASIFNISYTLLCRNQFTGESITLMFQGENNVFSIHAHHCGVLQIQFTNVQISDPLGLFSRHISFTEGCQVIILPIGHAVEIPLIGDTLDGDEYSTLKAGMDVSETYAIREYRPGDPIRSIHWKLSEKLDKIMVREFGLPVGSSVLIVLEAASNVDISPAGWDKTAELFFSVGLAFQHEGIAITMGWMRASGFATHELCSRSDISLAIRECLLTIKIGGSLRAFYDDGAFEHVLVVTAGNSPSMIFAGSEGD